MPGNLDRPVNNRSLRRIQELETLLQHSNSPKEEIDLLAELAWELRISQPERAEAVAQDAIDYAKTGDFLEAPYKTGLASGLVALAFVQIQAGQLDIGIKACTQAFSLLHETSESQITVRIWYTLSWASFFLGDQPTALEYALKALNQSNQHNLNIEKAWALDAIASIYSNTGNFSESLHHHHEAVQIFRENDDIDGTLRSLNNLAMCFYFMKEFDPALKNALQGMKIAQKWNIRHDMLNLSCTIAQILIDMGQLDQAEAHLRSAFADAEVLQRTNIYHVFVLMEWARLSLKRGDMEQAKTFLFRALVITEENNQKGEQAQCHKSLSEIYEQQGETGKALNHFKTYHVLNDEVAGERVANRMAALTLTYQIDSARQETEIYRLKANQLQSEMDEQKRTQKLLETLAKVDGLTGVANRRHFDERLVQDFSRHSRTGTELSLILLDIDHFKKFNDTYGHLAGDECLQQVAQVLKTQVSRTIDTVARFGGEEFACILPATDATAAIRIAERIRQAVFDLDIPHSASPTARQVTVSLGVVTAQSQSGISPVNLIATADQQLYKAKSAGRNSVFATELNIQQTYPRDEHPSVEMESLIWQTDFESGDSMIDSQHRELVASANHMLDSILSNQSHETTLLYLSELLEKTLTHFREEESILVKIGYAELQQHAYEHGKLARKGGELLHKFKSDTILAEEVVSFFSYEMILQHMLQSDRKFFPLLRTSSK